MPTRNGELAPRTQPAGADEPENAPVAHRRVFGFRPRIMFSMAPMKPEQSKPLGPTPPQMYGLPF